VVTGRVLPAADRRLLEAFARHASTVLEARRLRGDAAAARRAADQTMVRTALLAGVSHDLRTPLAAIKVAVSSLRQPDLHLDPDDAAALLADIESGTDRLDDVVGNLLDMSRLRMGDLEPRHQPVVLEEVVARAALGLTSPLLHLEVAEDTPPALADAGLLERVVANLLSNALRHAPGSRVTVTASTLGDRIELRVVDHGPGVPARRRAEMFTPFTRLADTDPEPPAAGGVGLGLAVARGFVEAMGGQLSADDTPGGGLTFVVDLPLAGSLADTCTPPADRRAVPVAGPAVDRPPAAPR